jgi:hypothetical protein
MLGPRTKLAAAGLVVVATGVLAAAASAAEPRSLTPPVVSGTPQQGRTLTTTNGTWDGNPTSFRYRWQRCNAQGASCVNIAGAIRQTYTLTAADVDHRVRSVVTAINADAAVDRASRVTAVVSANTPPRNTDRPVISGNAVVGSELTASTGFWTGGVRSFSFQWQRCDEAGANCVSVAGATGRTYGVRAADVTHTLRVVVTARNLAGATSATSDRTAVVDTGGSPPPQPPPPASNKRPTLQVLSMRLVGRRVFARFRACDDSGRNLTIFQRDVRTRVRSVTRRFSTSVAPQPCATYSRSWRPSARFLAAHGRYVVLMWARDFAGLQSKAVRRTFRR